MIIVFDNRTEFMLEEVFLEEIEEAITRTLLHEEVLVECEISFSFVSSQEIQELNKTYRGIDKPSDVLSFPMYEETKKNLKAVIKETAFLPVLLGDIVVSMEQAESQAKDYGHSLNREVSYLSVHSVLHLLGYDHLEAEEKSEMRAIEKEIMGDV